MSAVMAGDSNRMPSLIGQVLSEHSRQIEHLQSRIEKLETDLEQAYRERNASQAEVENLKKNISNLERTPEHIPRKRKRDDLKTEAFEEELGLSRNYHGDRENYGQLLRADKYMDEFCTVCRDEGELLHCSEVGCRVKLCISPEDSDRGCLLREDHPPGGTFTCPMCLVNQKHLVPYQVRDLKNLQHYRILHPLIIVYMVYGSENVGMRAFFHSGMLSLYKARSSILRFVAIPLQDNESMVLRTQEVSAWLGLYPDSNFLMIQEAFPEETQVSAHNLKNSFWSEISRQLMVNRGKKGLISLPCGYNLHYDNSYHSHMDLVKRKMLSWVLGFGARKVVANQVHLPLISFLESLLIHEQPLRTSVIHAYGGIPHTFWHTSIVFIEQTDNGVIQAQQFINDPVKWGLPRPVCPECRKMCSTNLIVRKSDKGVRFHCIGCAMSTKSVPKPDWVKDARQFPNAGTSSNCSWIYDFPIPQNCWEGLEWNKLEVGDTQLRP